MYEEGQHRPKPPEQEVAAHRDVLLFAKRQPALGPRHKAALVLHYYVPTSTNTVAETTPALPHSV